MLGCYDFCGHYEWTFEWMRRQGGDALVREYWAKAIGEDSQRHAVALIAANGIQGMADYWGHTLAHEGAGYRCTRSESTFRIDMHACPSKGFLIDNGLNQYHDYCDHCMGWIGPMMKKAGFVIDHQHNHRGQCWWEIRGQADPEPASGAGAFGGPHDVRLRSDWKEGGSIDSFHRATSAEEKSEEPEPM